MLQRTEVFLKSASAAGLVALLAANSWAQNPMLTLSDAQAGPGQTAMVTLSLSGSVADTNAVNFTIEIDAADRALIVEEGITASLAAGFPAGYNFEDNKIDDNGALQYRGVIYPRDSSIAAFNATASTPLVNISIPIAPGATDGVVELTIVNEFDDDLTTGLVGISDSEGNTVVSAPENPQASIVRNITKDDGAITIRTGDGIDFATSFPGDWQAYQIYDVFAKQLPTMDPASADPTLEIEQVAGTGVVFTNEGLEAFGFMEPTDPARISGLNEGDVLHVKWTVETNVTNPFDLPIIRLRQGADGQTQATVYQELTANPADNPMTVVPLQSDGKVKLHSIASVPATAVTNTVPDRAGMLVTYDMQAHEAANLPGAAGAIARVSMIEYESLNPATFTGGSVVLDEDYSGGDASATPFGYAFFTPSNPTVFTVNPQTTAGLGAELAGPAPTGRTDDFALALFTKPSTWTVAAGKVYKVEVVFATTAANPVNTNTARLRMSVGTAAQFGLADYVEDLSVESPGSARDTSLLPDAAGKTYTTWVNIPDVFAGMPVYLAFDAYRTTGFAAPADGSTIMMKSVKVTAYDRPAALTN